jgi:hypothetical protein
MSGPTREDRPDRREPTEPVPAEADALIEALQAAKVAGTRIRRP